MLRMASLLGCLALWSCTGQDPADPVEKPEPGALEVGHAKVRMPVPLGIGTAGFGGFGLDPSPSPFSEIYPGTRRIHNHPDFRVMVMTRGDGFELIFIRTDTVGMFQQLRQAVVQELEARLGRNLDDALIVGATHTHSGPGRVIDMGGPFDLIADRFFPEFYEGVVDTMADAIVEAYDNRTPGRVGTVVADITDGVNDRRCEDGLDYVNGTTPVVAIEQEGKVTAMLLAYPIHGTIMGIDELTLSQDVSGAIEQSIEDGFDHPVQVMMFNSWGGDMSPANPDAPAVEGVAQPAGYDRMEAIGAVVSTKVHAALPGMVFSDTPTLGATTFRPAINREVLGYQAGEFEYPYGAVYCTAEGDCDPDTWEEGLDAACVPFNEEFPAPNQTEITAGQVGDLSFITFPGEPGTLVAEAVFEGAFGEGRPDNVMFLGYTQDYLGYSILEEDWWNGGYEASGALWGPKQGQYLADQAAAALRSHLDGEAFGEEQPVVTPFDTTGYTPYVPETNPASGTVHTQPQAQVGPTDTVIAVVEGGDPWHGAPLATLVDAEGAPVLRTGGQPITSDGLAFAVQLDTDPAYADVAQSDVRSFQWRFELPVQHQFYTGLPALEGSYRLSVSVPGPDGQVSEVLTDPFEVVR